MEKKLSAKAFLTKSNGKAALSAAGFLESYRDYLLTGEVAYVTKPIIEKLESGQIMPTPALGEVKAAVLAHILEVERIKAEEALEKKTAKTEKPGRVAKKAPFEACIYDASTGKIATRIKDNGEVEDLIKGFDLPQQAERWCDRRLFEGCPSWYGTVTHVTAKFPEHAKDIINRDDSIARILSKGRGPVTKSPKFGGGSLSWGVKARESIAKFSKG